MEQFKCSMCGNCCRNVGLYKEKVYPALKELLGDKMPEFTLLEKDGVCIYLTKDNKCAIYESRPEICNTNKMFGLLSSAFKISRSELIELQNLSCKLKQRK